MLDRVAMNMYQSTMHEISSQKYINTGFTPRFDNECRGGNVDVGITYNNFRYLIAAATKANGRRRFAQQHEVEFAIVNKQISCYVAQVTSPASLPALPHSSCDKGAMDNIHQKKKKKNCVQIDMRQS